MMLGDLIAELADEATAMEALLATGDIAIVSRVRAAAAAAGQPVGECLEHLIGRFHSAASPDDWMAVMSAASRSQTPGAACLRAMLEVALGRSAAP